MVNPRGINVSCNYSDPIDQEQCLVDAIAAVTKNKADNLAERVSVKADYDGAKLNYDLCASGQSSCPPTVYNAYKSTYLAAISKLNTIDGYISDADVIIGDAGSGLTKKLSDLQKTSAYKNAIKNGAIPAKAPTLPATAKTITTDMKKYYIIGGVILLVLILVFIYFNKKKKAG